MGLPACSDDSSEAPVRYANGEVQIAVTDLSAGGYGKLWQHRRIYSNRLTVNADLGNGTNWLVETLPYLVPHPDGTITVVRGTRKSLWFDPVDGNYVGRYGALSTLIHDAENACFVLTLPGGGQYRFHDFEQEEAPQGAFAAHRALGGQLTEVTSYTLAQRIEEVRRSTGEGANRQTQSFRYAHDRSATPTTRKTVSPRSPFAGALGKATGPTSSGLPMITMVPTSRSATSTI